MSSFLKTIDFGIRALLFNRFGSLLDLESINRGVILYPKEVAFRMISEKKDAAISEFINVWRNRTSPSWERQKTPAARHGMRVSYVDNSGQTQTTVVKAVPVDLGYDVWFWSKDIDNLNLIAEKYLFWQQDDPNLSLYYNSIYPVELDLHFGELVDESDVPSMLDRGNHFVMRAPIDIDGWVFESTDTGGVIQKIELVLHDHTNLDEVRECISEATEYYDATTEEALRMYEEHIFGIIGVNTSINSFYVKADSGESWDDIIGEFDAATYLYVDGSTGNDRRYTILSASAGDGYTIVSVSETIEDITVDGTISLKNI